MAKCDVCFHRCEIQEGKLGFCGARTCKGGHVLSDNYGRITALALDPIEKKPLNRFHPGSLILSAGSYGCNLHCPFCQNHEISWSDQAMDYRKKADYISPEELAATALYYRPSGNIGLAFTYNEPLIGYEYIRDAGRLVHDQGMVNVLVTNGTADLHILKEIAPYIDAMNIDLKGFSDAYYKQLIGGSLEMVLDFIREAVKICHVELTTLIIPGENDSDEEIRQMTRWISRLEDASGKRIGYRIPLHISRFFPRFHMTDRDATDVKQVYHLAAVAREHLKTVYTGNC